MRRNAVHKFRNSNNDNHNRNVLFGNKQSPAVLGAAARRLDTVIQYIDAITLKTCILLESSLVPLVRARSPATATAIKSIHCAILGCIGFIQYWVIAAHAAPSTSSNGIQRTNNNSLSPSPSCSRYFSEIFRRFCQVKIVQ